MNQSSTKPGDRFSGDDRITPAMEDYLKAIYTIEQEADAVTTQRLAAELGFSGASVTNMVKRLNDLNLLVHLPYRGVSLTPAGTAVALEVIRHHRLLELYLSQALGFDIEQVHEEADRLEHHVSEELEARMEAALGYPEFDPHGHPIPTRSGTVPSRPDILLTELQVRETGIVSRVGDRDPERLRQLNSWGIRPGVKVTIVDRTDTGSMVKVGNKQTTISGETAALIHVLPESPDPTS